MQQDNEGFLYPQVDENTCIDCGLCEKVCPIVHPYEKREPIKVLAAINKDEEIRMQSSSGGIFSLLAEIVIHEGGVVFGARFDEEWQVTLDYTETIEGLAAFRGSKYVQARIGDTYKQCEQFLKDGRMVLYSGTPCQVAGLKHFLRKEYDNLFAVDFLCHGVPSPKVWAKYLEETTHTIQNTVGAQNRVSSSPLSVSLINDIRFRDKSKGWKKYHFILTLNEYTSDNVKESDSSSGGYVQIDECFNENVFMKAFLRDLILRPSCYACPARSGRSHSDITIADYWGIQNRHPEIDDDKGTGLVIIHTSKGEASISYEDVLCKESSLEGLVQYNGGLKETVSIHPRRDDFFNKLDNTSEVTALINKSLQTTLSVRVKKKLYHILSKIYQTVKSE